MPEGRHGSGLDEVDALFADLIGEVDSRTRAVGATRAVRTARRRRAGMVAGLTAAVVAIGAVVGVGVIGGPDSGERVAAPAAPVTAAAPTPGEDTTTPAPLNATRLDTAGRGWVTGWKRTTDSGVEADLSCLGTYSGLSDATVTHYRSGAAAADHLRTRFASTQAAGETTNVLSGRLDDRCASGQGSYYGGYGVNRDVWAFGVGRDIVFLGQRDAAFAMLVVSGAPTLTDDELSSVADALMADLAAG